MASAAGVFGGRESRRISATGTGSGAATMGTSGGVMVRDTERRGRPRGFTLGSFFFCGFSASFTDDRCFFGDSTGSVLTGSVGVSTGSHTQRCCSTHCYSGLAEQEMRVEASRKLLLSLLLRHFCD